MTSATMLYSPFLFVHPFFLTSPTDPHIQLPPSSFPLQPHSPEPSFTCFFPTSFIFASPQSLLYPPTKSPSHQFVVTKSPHYVKNCLPHFFLGSGPTSKVRAKTKSGFLMQSSQFLWVWASPKLPILFTKHLSWKQRHCWRNHSVKQLSIWIEQ